MTRTLARLLLPLALALLAARPAAAAVPPVLTYTGYLKTAAGAPVTVATDLTFRLYGGPADPTPLWIEQVSVVPSSDGWFSAVLGATSPIPAALAGEPLWLALQVGADAEFTERLRLTPSPAALAVDWSGVQGKPTCDPDQFLTLDGAGALACATPSAAGLTAVAVGAGLTGQGTAQSPLGLVLGAGGAQAALAFPGPGSCPPGQLVSGVDAASGLVACAAPQVASVTAAPTPGNPILVSGGADPTIDIDQARLLPPTCLDGQVMRYGVGQGWVCDAAVSFAGVAVAPSLTGNGFPGLPLSVRVGSGLVVAPEGLAVDAGPGLLLLPGSPLAVDLAPASATAGASTQVARADHRHPGAPMVQLKPADFVEQPSAAPPVLGRLSLDANEFPWRVVPVMTMPPQSIAFAVAQFPAGVVEGTAATVHLSVAGETAGAEVVVEVRAAAYGLPGTSLGGNLSDLRSVSRVLPAKGTDVVTLEGVSFFPRTQPPRFQEPPVPGDAFILVLLNSTTGAGAAPWHLLGAQITFHTP